MENGSSGRVKMASINGSLFQLLLLTIFFLSCQQTAHESRRELTRADTLAVLQTILDDEPLDTLINKIFTVEKLKLVAGRIVKQDYKLTHKGKPVSILLQDSTLIEPHYNKPLRFNVRVQTLKVRKDTVQVFIIFGATNHTVDFRLVNGPPWRVVTRSFGRI